MQIFLAGATGAVGQRLIPLLANAGHSIISASALARESALTAQAGSEPVITVLDRQAIRAG